MKTLTLDEREEQEEVLITYKGRSFLLKNMACGQYSYERKVLIYAIDSSTLERKGIKYVGILRLFSKDEVSLVKQCQADQCIIIGSTTFDKCMVEAKTYLKNYIDFIN